MFGHFSQRITAILLAKKNENGPQESLLQAAEN